MAKKIVRLTESQLHDIIAESINQILEAWDYKKYKQAQQQHPNLMNKVDPRTFSIRNTNGTNAQGKTRNDKKNAMTLGADNAWTNRYGFDKGEYNEKTTMTDKDQVPYYHNSLYMSNGNIERDLDTTTGKWGGLQHKDSRTVSYDPNSDITSNKHGFQYSNGYERRSQKGMQIPEVSPEGLNVAKQMAKGNGKYIPNQGWQ